ncbi:hypothetical protein G3N96_35980 [Burkholderia sp. Se-20373]|uniref:hypothetical protein n=1 Tax=Burkholderia sp. Se-20373 TaxID=2703898 RepID=UPI00197F4B1A|nr:hypothetical protein [Burkholderia sp. Se-20373]MBN3750767.1 hypothetical protein [Burkholderia sp. Se-20373]
MITTFVLFKHSKESFLSELNRASIKYSPVETFSSGIMASGELIAIAQTVASSTAVATIVSAWLKARASRKVIVTTKDNQVTHLEGYSVKDIEKILSVTDRVAVIESDSNSNQNSTSSIDSRLDQHTDGDSDR